MTAELWTTAAAEPTFGIHVGTVRLTTHPPDKCAGRPCVVHAPSDHHMRDWPTLYRADKGMTERTCPHGVGHPDPDDLAWQISEGRDYQALHGCDGCCTPAGYYIALELPYAVPPLTLNSRMHWAKKARIVKDLRWDMEIIARAMKLPKGLGRVEITLHYQPRTTRARDEDNLFATLKPCIDGLTDYGLVTDDDSAHVTSRCRIEPKGAVSRLWLTIKEI